MKLQTTNTEIPETLYSWHAQQKRKYQESSANAARSVSQEKVKGTFFMCLRKSRDETLAYAPETKRLSLDPNSCLLSAGA